MGVVSERLRVVLELVSGQYKREARAVAKSTKEIGEEAATSGTHTKALGDRMSGMSVKAQASAGIAAAAFLRMADVAIAAASDLEESINAVGVVFGGAAGEITRFGETAASKVGLAASEFNQLSATTGALLMNFGLSASQAADETINLTTRAADLASVFNTDVADAMGAIQAALRGETEPIRRFAVNLDDASVRAKAVELGLAATTGEVDRNAKAMAALQIIYEQTNAVAGDFARTSESVANQQRIAAAETENLKAQLGEMMLPIKAEVLKGTVQGIGLLSGAWEILGNVFDKDARESAQMRQALGFLRREVGGFAGNEAAAVVQILGSMGGALTDNEAAVRELAREVGASAEDLDIAARGVEDLADQLGLSENDARAYGDQLRSLADEAREVEREQRLFEQALRDVDTAAADTSTTLRDRLAAETRALKQPLQNILDTAGRFRDAANAMETEMTSALQAIGFEAGVTVDDILRLKATIEAVNDLGLVGVDEGVIRFPESKRSRSTFRRHGGAFGPGPLVVGEANLPEVIVMPGSSGAVFSNSDVRRIVQAMTRPPTPVSSEPQVIQLVVDGDVLAEVIRDVEMGRA